MSKEPNKRLFVGALPFKFTEGELVTLFAPFGRITALRIMHNQWGKSRGMGFVEYDELQQAINAKHELHNYAVEPERTIIVDFAEPDPYLTPEGAARHIAAQALKKKKRPSASLPEVEGGTYQPFEAAPKKKFVAPKPTSVSEEKPVFHGKSYFEHQRPTVFKSRAFHAKVGAKFSSRTKTKTSR
ncbi:MAG: RNA-binding protein [Candidatus Shapirobacteria bacterium]